jgi:hypothetical protein
MDIGIQDLNNLKKTSKTIQTTLGDLISAISDAAEEVCNTCDAEVTSIVLRGLKVRKNSDKGRS